MMMMKSMRRGGGGGRGMPGMAQVASFRGGVADVMQDEMSVNSEADQVTEVREDFPESWLWHHYTIRWSITLQQNTLCERS